MVLQRLTALNEERIETRVVLLAKVHGQVFKPLNICGSSSSRYYSVQLRTSSSRHRQYIPCVCFESHHSLSIAMACPLSTFLFHLRIIM
jgi:hypothetical protein